MIADVLSRPLRNDVMFIPKVITDDVRTRSSCRRPTCIQIIMEYPILGTVPPPFLSKFLDPPRIIGQSGCCAPCSVLTIVVPQRRICGCNTPPPPRFESIPIRGTHTLDSIAIYKCRFPITYLFIYCTALLNLCTGQR